MSFIPIFLTAGPAQGGDQVGALGGTFGMLLPLVLIFAIMYFLMIRPQQKRQKEIEKMLGALKKGDKVVTGCGIYGIVSSIKEKENTIVLKVDDNVKIEFNRSAVVSVVTDKPAAEVKTAAE